MIWLWIFKNFGNNLTCIAMPTTWRLTRSPPSKVSPIMTPSGKHYAKQSGQFFTIYLYKIHTICFYLKYRISQLFFVQVQAFFFCVYAPVHILSRQCLKYATFLKIQIFLQPRIHGWDSPHCQGHWKTVQAREIVALHGTAVLLVHSIRSTTTVSKNCFGFPILQMLTFCNAIFRPLNPLGSRFEIQLTITWIKTHLEEDQQVSLPKHEVYDDYL